MRRLAAAMAMALVLSGCCTSDKCIAVTTSNMMHDAALAAAESIRIGCTNRYHAADSAAVIAQLDKPCLPAAAAYGDFAKAQARLEAVLTAVLAGEPGVAMSEALAAAREAAVVLAAKIGDVPR